MPCDEVSADVFASLSARMGLRGLGAVLHQRWERLSTCAWVMNYAGLQQSIADPA